MALPQEQSLRVTIAGDDITAYDVSNEWTLGEKLELTYNIRDTDGDQTINVDNINDTQFLIFFSSADFNVVLTIGANVMTFPVRANYPLILPVPQAFVDTLDSIEVNTSSLVDVTIEIRAYGKEVIV